MTPGDAFYLNVADSHRYCVVFTATNPCRKVVVFNFSTFRPGHCDEACIIKADEYSGIVHTSVIAYSYGLLLEGETLDAFQQEMGRKLPRLSEELVQKIREGALKSQHTKLKIKRLLSRPSHHEEPPA